MNKYKKSPQGKKSSNPAVVAYNQQRPHLGIGNLTPQKLHQANLHRVSIKTERLWKNYYTPSRKQSQKQSQMQTCPSG